VNNINPRAQLVLVHERIHDIEAATEVIVSCSTASIHPANEPVEIAILAMTIDDAGGTSLVWFPSASTEKPEVTVQPSRAVPKKESAAQLCLI
jgi:hypothetical protein